MSTETWSVGAPREKCGGSLTKKVLRFPCITDLYKMFRQILLCRYHWGFRYLVIQCQEVVVEPEGSNAGWVRLGFKRLAILGNIAAGKSCIYLCWNAGCIKQNVSFSITKVIATTGLTCHDRTERDPQAQMRRAYRNDFGRMFFLQDTQFSMVSVERQDGDRSREKMYRSTKATTLWLLALNIRLKFHQAQATRLPGTRVGYGSLRGKTTPIPRSNEFAEADGKIPKLEGYQSMWMGCNEVILPSEVPYSMGKRAMVLTLQSSLLFIPTV